MMCALEQRLGNSTGQRVRKISDLVMLTAAAMALVRLSV
jgi:hypothetical protein